MARTTQGSIGGEVRGSVGNTVHTSGHYGTHVRIKSKPVTRTTARTVAVRAGFGAIASAWSTLPDLDKIAWDTFAATQGPSEAFGPCGSGQEVFSTLNGRLLTSGQAMRLTVSEPAEMEVPAPLTSCVLSAPNPATLNVEIEGPPGWAASWWMWIEFAISARRGKRPEHKAWRFYTVETKPLPILENWAPRVVELFGSIQSGQTIGVQVCGFDRIVGVIGPRTIEYVEVT